MNKECFNNIIKDMPKNGVKRACYIVREYLRYSENVKIDKDMVLKGGEGCPVTLEEYLEAVNILLSFSYENSEDITEVELFNCENDCCHNMGFNNFCKGEFSLTSKSKELKLCKYYSDSQYI